MPIVCDINYKLGSKFWDVVAQYVNLSEFGVVFFLWLTQYFGDLTIYICLRSYFLSQIVFHVFFRNLFMNQRLVFVLRLITSISIVISLSFFPFWTFLFSDHFPCYLFARIVVYGLCQLRMFLYFLLEENMVICFEDQDTGRCLKGPPSEEKNVTTRM